MLSQWTPRYGKKTMWWEGQFEFHQPVYFSIRWFTIHINTESVFCKRSKSSSAIVARTLIIPGSGSSSTRSSFESYSIKEINKQPTSSSDKWTIPTFLFWCCVRDWKALSKRDGVELAIFLPSLPCKREEIGFDCFENSTIHKMPNQCILHNPRGLSFGGCSALISFNKIQATLSRAGTALKSIQKWISTNKHIEYYIT